MNYPIFNFPVFVFFTYCVYISYLTILVTIQLKELLLFYAYIHLLSCKFHKCTQIHVHLKSLLKMITLKSALSFLNSSHKTQ